jgi:hypothetical protein
MNAIPNDDSPNVSIALDHVIRAHGVLAVLVALVLRPWRARKDHRNIRHAGLTDHMLRDIGVDPPSEMERQTRHMMVMAMMLRGHG